MRNNKKDLAQGYFQQGANHLKQAILMDRSGNIDMAKNYYRQAISSFTLADNQPTDPSSPLKAQIQQQLESCQRRLRELESLIPAQETTPSAGGAAQQSHPKKSNGSGGGGGGKKDEQDESKEFKDKMSNAILVEKPDVKWDDVAGLAEAKRALNEAVILPMRFPHFFTGERAPWRGILLYGPPGTGKSFLAKATATESGNSTFLTVSTSDLVSKWLGESEKLIRALFETAREHKPAIIFIDEIDSLLSERSENDSESARRIKTEFLIQMDGVGKSMDGILLLAATNIPWGLDPAVRRRFEKKIYIPLPDLEARAALLKLKLKETPNTLKEEDIWKIAESIEGYSGADIKILTREAAMLSIRKLQQAEYFCEYNGKMYACNADYPGAKKMKMMDIPPDRLEAPPVQPQDFQESIQKIRASVSPSDLIRFEEWTSKFGQEGN